MKGLPKKKWLAVVLGVILAIAVSTAAFAATSPQGGHPLTSLSAPEIDQRTTQANGQVALTGSLPTGGDPAWRYGTDPSAATMPGVGVAGKLTFQGSTTVGPIVQNTVNDYNSFRHATVIGGSGSPYIVMQASGQGRNAAAWHWTDIAMSSSIPGNNWSTAPQLTPYAVARDAVCFIINESGSAWTGHQITSLDKATIANIYNGSITDWGSVHDAVNTTTFGPAGVAIIPRMRDIGSGTRAAFKDGIGSQDPPTPVAGKITYDNPDVDYTSGTAPAAPMSENWLAYKNNLTTYARALSNAEMQGFLDSPTASGQCGYVGLGFESGPLHNMTVISINISGTSYAPSEMNTYANKGDGTPFYPLARFLWLATPNNTETYPTYDSGTYTAPNSSEITSYISWLKATDGQGQADVVATGFLKLVPDILVVPVSSGTPKWVINSQDLGMVCAYMGKDVSTIPDAAKRALCVRTKTVVNSQDLGKVCAWMGISIVPSS